MKVFWSWQSDTPGNIGRFLVRDALKEAIEQLKQAPEIEEPTSKKTREELHLDQDVQGKTGSPDLARTILDKIDASTVFIADVTLVGNVPDSKDDSGNTVPGKKLINSNVAIELGYALCKLTDANVIMVFNAHYGAHENLPFDLRHKGGSIKFTLSPDASKPQIAEERKKLKDRFVQALKPYLQKTAVPAAPFVETPSTFTNAAYFQRGEVIAQAGKVTYSYAAETLAYLRLIPISPLPKSLLLSTLKEVALRAPLLKRKDGAFFGTLNHYGGVGYSPGSPTSSQHGTLNASTQLFENGEIWSIGASLIMSERNGAPEWARLPALSCPLFEQVYYDLLGDLIRFASEHLALKLPWQVELGLVGIAGLHLYALGGAGAFEAWGPVRKSEVIQRLILNDDSESSNLLLEFFSKVYDAAGEKRPERLYGFPPNRPTG